MRLHPALLLFVLPPCSAARVVPSRASPALAPRFSARCSRVHCSTSASGWGSQGRTALALLSGAGAIETGVITANRLGGGAVEALCLVGGGCSDVLTGPWATVPVVGVPLSAVGMAAYSAVFILAAFSLARPSTEGGWLDGALLAMCAAMATFSGCLMTLLLSLGQSCPLCIGSACLSAGLLVAAWNTPLLRTRTESMVLGGCACLVTLAAAGGLYALKLPEAEGATLNRPPTIAAHSSPRASAVAERMRSHGAQMYGAFWCSHCLDQKETLGREAFKTLPYIECDPQGEASQATECRALGVRGYPTWQLEGELYAGERSLEELEELLDQIDAPAKSD